MNRIIRDSSAHLQFTTDGYAVVPFVTQSQIEQLKRLFHEYCPDSSHGDNAIFYSLFANDIVRNIEIRNKMREFWCESYERTFINYQPFAESFLAKGKTDEQLMLHQDWNYSEEGKFFSATIWCPLSDTDTENGTLFVLPGSHHFFQTFRSGTLPASRIATDEKLVPYIVPVNVKAGEAVIFQQGLFHGSYPNKSGELRVIAAAIILEKGKSATYYHQMNSGEVELYEMNDDIFLEEIINLTAMKKPVRGTLKNKKAYRHRTVTAEDLLERLKRENILV